jgi:NAD(P)-dependent dehydrogenase (short-subunit alcohol dehydrogenase family)
MPIPPAPDLSGKVAIVTGASRGIGRALAVGLARAGASVVCAARTEVVQPGGLPGTIHTTAEAIRAAGGEALPLRCDVGEPADVEALVETTVGKLGRVDVLVNNAMTPTRGLFDETPLALWDESMRVNVRSLFTTCQAVVPRMARVGGGSIINVSSGAADPRMKGLPPGFLTYAVAKAALERFSTALAIEVAERGIAVNAMRPGAVKTEKSVDELGEDWDWSDWQEPEAVVPALLFLAAQTASGFTGRIVDSTEFGERWP